MTSAPIPQNDPGASYRAQSAEIDDAVASVLAGGWYILGEKTVEFEREFAAAMGCEHAVGVGSGTDALAIALRALGVSTGDRVATVSHTAVATVAAVEMINAVPILVDIEPAYYTMDPKSLEAALERSKRQGQPIKAVVPVHLYGHSADLNMISDLAARYGAVVCEDCAQAHGARFEYRPVGSTSPVGCFSLYPTKNLGAFGDGGVVTTQSPALANECRALREYGWRSRRYVSETVGVNSRLDELHAAILRVKLRRLAGDNERRREIALRYGLGLKGLPVDTPAVDPRAEHVYHQYVVTCANRDALQRALREGGVGTGIHYPVPIHLQPAYEGRVIIGPTGLGRTERAAASVLSLPMFPQLENSSVDRVIDLIQKWARESSHEELPA